MYAIIEQGSKQYKVTEGDCLNIELTDVPPEAETFELDKVKEAGDTIRQVGTVMRNPLSILDDPAPVVGLSCMANLLPFTILAMKALRDRYPDRTLVLGGVGSKSVEDKVLARFPWVDIIARGESELTGPELLGALGNGGDLSAVKGISYRTNGGIRHNPDRERIAGWDGVGWTFLQPKEPRIQGKVVSQISASTCIAAVCSDTFH